MTACTAERVCHIHSSYANEVVTKGICIFKMTAGNTKEAILAGVNMGRDTDCVAAVAAGIAGALTGGESIPEEWQQAGRLCYDYRILTQIPREH